MSWETVPGRANRPNVHIGFAAPQPVSTETPLLDLTELGSTYDRLRFVLDNQSANTVFLVVEHGETASKADVERRVIAIAPGKQGSIKVRDVDELFWRLAAYSDPDGSYPPSNSRWLVIGWPRA